MIDNNRRAHHYAPDPHKGCGVCNGEYKMAEEKRRSGPNAGLLIAAAAVGAILVWWFFLRGPADGTVPAVPAAIEEPARVN